MLALPHTNSWGFRYSPVLTNVVAVGASITPGASDVEGTLTEVVPDASVTTEIQYIVIRVHGGTSSTAAKLHLLDMAYDPTGGTTYDQFLFQNLVCGASGVISSNQAGNAYHFPCKIPAGSAIAARVQGSNASAGAVRLVVELYGKPSRPELWRPAAYSETLGYTSGTLGTSFTPGTDAYGDWASLGTTTKKHFWAQLGVQCDNAVFANLSAGQCQLGIGAGAAGDTHVISETLITMNTTENLNCGLQTPCTWEIPAGSELWVRGSFTNTPDTGWNATAVLFGG